MELVDTGTRTELELNDIFVVKLQEAKCIQKQSNPHISRWIKREHEGKKEKGKREDKEKQPKR